MNGLRPNKYQYSVRLLLPLLRIMQGKPSSLSHDAELLLDGAPLAPCVMNAQHIPTDSSFFIVFNHYDRPGLGAWWVIAPIATTIAMHRACAPREIHVMMAREWYYPNGFNHWVKQPFTRWFFGQFAKAYGCIGLPPALNMEQFRGQGASALRHTLTLTHAQPPEIVAVSPEGNTGNNLGLCHPPRGTGLMLMLLTYETLPFLPIGIFENDEERIHINVGEPFHITISHPLSKEERDQEASRQVMIQIGKLLPEHMHGVYRHDIQAPLP